MVVRQLVIHPRGKGFLGVFVTGSSVQKNPGPHRLFWVKRVVLTYSLMQLVIFNAFLDDFMTVKVVWTGPPFSTSNRVARHLTVQSALKQRVISPTL